MNDFKLITIDAFVKKTMKANQDLDETRLRHALNEFKTRKNRGELCECGEPIWIIVSAMTGNACFTCTTGETYTGNDYEISE
jgi:hypothetical protein